MPKKTLQSFANFIWLCHSNPLDFTIFKISLQDVCALNWKNPPNNSNRKSSLIFMVLIFH